MKNKEITVYELMGLIKDGKAPEKIKYDDFYCEPSESDLAIQKLKEHLKNEVKSEIINELKQ